MKMKRKSLTVAICAVLVALTFVLGWIPYGGPFLLPMLFAACCFSLGISFFSSVMFGVVSLLLSLTMPNSFIGWFFLNNLWVPIVARMFIGPIAHFLYKGLTKLVKPTNTFKKILPISLTAAAGSLLNTIFVGTLLLVLPKNGIPDGMAALGMTELVIFGSIEIAVNAVLLPPIVLGVKRALPRLFKEMNSAKEKRVENSSLITNESPAAIANDNEQTTDNKQNG